MLERVTDISVHYNVTSNSFGRIFNSVQRSFPWRILVICGIQPQPGTLGQPHRVCQEIPANITFTSTGFQCSQHKKQRIFQQTFNFFNENMKNFFLEAFKVLTQKMEDLIFDWNLTQGYLAAEESVSDPHSGYCESFPERDAGPGATRVSEGKTFNFEKNST